LKGPPVLVQEVAETKTKKRPVKYFGRTAKIYLVDTSQQEMIQELTIEMKKVIERTIMALNPDELPSTYSEILNNHLDRLVKSKMTYRKSIELWLERHGETLVKANIDIKGLHRYLQNAEMLFASNSEGEIRRLLRFSEIFH